jgi:hypothetical protein
MKDINSDFKPRRQGKFKLLSGFYLLLKLYPSKQPVALFSLVRYPGALKIYP